MTAIATRNGPCKGGDNHLCILFWNAGGLSNSKHAELKVNAFRHDADIIIIVEAGASTDATCFYEITDYSLYVIKRSRQVASGIIAYVRNLYASKSTIIHEMDNQDKLEAISIDIWKNGVHFTVIGLYNPPNNVPNLDLIMNMSQHHNTIVVGDFNAHSTRWGYSSSNATGKCVEDMLDQSSLIRIPSDPTFLSYAGHTSTPDLALAHANLSSRVMLYLKDPLEGCGHRLMYAKILGKNRQPGPPKLTRWNFKKANWAKYSLLSDAYLPADLVNANPDASTELFVKGLLRAANESIPKGQVKKYSPFWNCSLDRLKRDRNKLRLQAERSHSIADCTFLRKSQSKLKRAVTTAKRHAYRSFVAKLDFRKDGPKAHKFISRLNNDASTRHWEPITANGKLLTSPSDVASALSKHYAAISRLSVKAEERKAITQDEAPSCQTEEEYLLFSKDFTPDELTLAIATLKKGKSAGPDEVFPDLIKNLGPLALNTFLKLINLTWNTRVPHQWRKAVVMSLLKRGKPASNLSSYRPISLTSVCCKAAEKMVERRLREFVEKKGAISDCQAGFRKHRSTMDQVVKFTQAVKDGFHRKQSTLAVLVDFKAAYDKVWRRMLISKLKRLGVNGNKMCIRDRQMTMTNKSIKL